MKKLAIVLAALLLACVFVGCNPGTMLPNTAWKGDWGIDYGNTYEIWTFNDDGTMTYAIYSEDGIMDGVPLSAEWVYENDILTISGSGVGGIAGEYRVEMTLKELNLYVGDSEEPEFSLVRYNEDAE